MEQFGVVVVAAGKGKRMGTAESKQFLLLDGKPIIAHTLQVFQNMPEVSCIILVVGEGDEQRCEQYKEQFGLAKIHKIVAGGLERQSSVLNGLHCLPAGTAWVLVHDGVRPFIRAQQILACWSGAQQAGAAVLAVSVKDTIKVVSTDGFIESTPDRQSLWAIQTPQAFRLADLIHAHEQAVIDSIIGTDDAMLVERMGRKVAVIEGSYTNIKITTLEDLAWAEYSVQQHRGGLNDD